MSEPIRIVIVDDHPLLRAGVIACLAQDPGIVVVGQADHGEQALQEARRLCPDLIVMDIGLAGAMDGIEATRRLREELPQTQVLIFTMHNEPHYVRRSLAARARGYALKDLGGAELLLGIRAVHAGGLFLSRGVVDDRTDRDLDALTPSEIEVLCLIAQGLSNKEIARVKNCSPRTVESQRLSIRNKLGLFSTAALTIYALENHLCH
jgi:two-component system nitrate/nitrite response regulator NarL